MITSEASGKLLTMVMNKLCIASLSFNALLFAVLSNFAECFEKNMIRMNQIKVLAAALILAQHIHALPKNLVVPTTKWCGKGNIAKDYDDLGMSFETDSCCRAHDHCAESIEGGGSKYGLQNDATTTRSHCDCDLRFFRCLSEIGSKFSRIIRFQYFHTLQMKCYRFEYPIVRCSRAIGKKNHEQCQEYIVDIKKPQIWQWFDNALSDRRAL